MNTYNKTETDSQDIEGKLVVTRREQGGRRGNTGKEVNRYKLLI